MVIPTDPLLMTLGAALLLAVAAGLGLLRLRRVFTVAIRAGRATPEQGRPPAGFPAACTDVARRYGIREGRITAERTGGGVRLRFSASIPPRSHQAFRNVWTPPPPGGGPGGGGRAAA